MVRPSHVRNAIAAILSGEQRHGWSIDDVLLELRGRGVTGEYSTVFRGLTHLERAGQVQRVDLGDGKVRYEMASAHHDHVRCETCGEVAAVPGCLVPEATAIVHTETGYTVTGHRLLFSGYCPACVAEEDMA